METHPVSLPAVAVELIELIADLVDSDDLRSLRLVCRELQRKTFHHFARRFFSSIKTDLSDTSLRRINALSRYPALCPYVHSLAFGNYNGIGRGLVWDRHPWGPLSAPLEMEAIQSLRDTLMLKLTNCRSFFILCRYPEGHPDFSHVTITDAVAVFFALVVDAPLPVMSFHLVYANKCSQTLIMDMRRLPKLLYRQPRFRVVWGNLQKLSLEQYLTLDNFGFLLELVLSTRNLRALLLNLGSHGLAYEFMHELAESGTFTRLQELALFRTSIRATDLLKLLGRLRGSLNALTFYYISVASVDSWAGVFKELRENFPALQRVSLSYLWASTPAKGLLSFPDLQKESILCDPSGQHLNLFYSESSRTTSVLGVEYSGSKISQVLGLLQTAAELT